MRYCYACYAVRAEGKGRTINPARYRGGINIFRVQRAALIVASISIERLISDCLCCVRY